MREHVEDVNALAVIVDGGDQAVGVGEIKNGDGASAGYFDLVGVRKGFSGVHQTAPNGFAGDGVPVVNRRCGFGVFLGGGIQSLAGDDTHDWVIGFS